MSIKTGLFSNVRKMNLMLLMAESDISKVKCANIFLFRFKDRVHPKNGEQHFKRISRPFFFSMKVNEDWTCQASK